MIQSAFGLDAAELISSSRRNLEAGFALARALVVLSIFLLTAQVVHDGTPFAPARVLLSVYSMYAAALVLVSVAPQRKASQFFLVAVHIADVIWACIFAATLGSLNAVLLLFVFPLLTATFRWGPSATLGTTLALVAGLEGLNAAPFFGLGSGDPDAVFQTSAFITLLGLLFAHVDQNYRQTSRTQITASADAFPSGTPLQIVEAVVEKTFGIFRPAHIQLIVNEASTGRTFLWHADASHASTAVVHSEEFDHANGSPHLRLLPAGDWALDRTRKHDSLLLVSPNGETKKHKGNIPNSFSAHFAKYTRVVSAAITVSDEWEGRLIICDPSCDTARAALQVLQKFSAEIAPAIHMAQMCLRACRATSAEERARLARELHDGVIQSLLGADLRLETLKRRTGRVTDVEDDVREVQEILRTEAKGLRQLVNDSRRRALSPERLVEYLSDLLERFQRDSGLMTHFFADLDHGPMPPRICHEFARMTEEAITNARKHSRGSTLIVRVGCAADNWLLVIIDDGVGFEFQGTWPLQKLISAGMGPRVIKDRVQLLGGDLLIESTAAGARIEIAIPKNNHSHSELSLQSQLVQMRA